MRMASSGYLIALSIVAALTIFVGSAASVTLIWLLREIGLWTDHSTLIYYMAVGQLIYCVMFYKDGLLGISTSTSVRDTIYIMNCVGTAGLMASFIYSSFLSYMVFYMIKRRKLLTLQKLKYILYLTLCLVLSIFIGAVILGLSKHPTNWVLVHGAFYAAELFLCLPIAFNFGCYFACWSSLDTLITESRNIGMNAMMFTQGKALETLVNRIKWYPIVQSMSRAFMIWYTSNINWGGHLGDYDGVSYLESKVDTGRFTVQITSFLAVLVAPVGFLSIFLSMQPYAKKYLKLRMKIIVVKYCPSCLFDEDAESLDMLLAEKSRLLGLLRDKKKLRTGINSESHDSGSAGARFISTSSNTSNKRSVISGNNYRNSVTSSYLLIPASTTSSSQEASYRYYGNDGSSQSTEDTSKTGQQKGVVSENDSLQPLLHNANAIYSFPSHLHSGDEVSNAVDWDAMSDVDLLSMVTGSESDSVESGESYVL